MNRRDFIATGLTATAATTLPDINLSATTPAPKHNFKLNYAPHFGMFKNHTGDDLLTQLQFFKEQGFNAIEDNGMPQRPVADQEKIGRGLADLKMTMGVFVVGRFKKFGGFFRAHDGGRGQHFGRRAGGGESLRDFGLERINEKTSADGGARRNRSFQPFDANHGVANGSAGIEHEIAVILQLFAVRRARGAGIGMRLADDANDFHPAPLKFGCHFDRDHIAAAR